MSNSDDSLGAFISALDAINDFCDARVNDRGGIMTLIRILGKDYTFSREAADKLEKARGICRYDIASLYPLPILYKAKENKA